MVEVGKLMLLHKPCLSIHILIATLPYNSAFQSLPSLQLLQCTPHDTLLSIDFFSTSAHAVASHLNNIPSYYFYTSGAGVLAISTIYLPTLHHTIQPSFKDHHSLVHIPSSNMINPILDRNDKAYDCFIEATNNLRESAGIIVNTFEIAIGLERSGQRFLWVVHNPPTNTDQSLATTAPPDPELDTLLPERTKETGHKFAYC